MPDVEGFAHEMSTVNMTVKVKKWNTKQRPSVPILPIIIPDLTPVVFEEVITDEQHVLKPTRRNLMQEFSAGKQ